MGVSLPAISWGAMLPMLLITATGLLVLILDPLTPPERRDRLAFLSLGGVLAAAAAVLLRHDRPEIVFGGMLAADEFAFFFNLLFLLVAGLTLLISIPYINRADMDHGGYYALLLFSTLGMMIMASSLDLMTIFLGLETLSISLYILAGFLREQLKSNESALKYLLLGAFASGFVLYGIALVYGATGSINLKRVAEALATGRVSSLTLLVIGMGLLIVGFGFKVASVPFHMWTPDVYEGAPTSVTAFMIAGTKAAAFAAFLRILMTALPLLQADWSRVLWVLAALTMTVGNVVAIAQSSIKRMLAYSSIAHAGYILVALVSASKLGSGSVLFYLTAYTFMNLGAFAVIIALGRRDGERELIDDYAGLGLKYPFLGAAMALFMFSLAGVPPTGGFMGKFYIFSAAIQAKYLGLAIIGVLNSVISAFYYLRVTVVMYMNRGEGEAAPGGLTPTLALAVIIAILGTLQLGLFPSRLLEVALRSVGALLL
ncbi:MAG TPA: NADH-quinone oxidoreductase subunit N [Candidatus Methylomirabilis sp.]|nr:NADH-quinone oxidoreductase subunit N [Candidatus Methylomirabilis sp.]